MAPKNRNTNEKILKMVELIGRPRRLGWMQGLSRLHIKSNVTSTELRTATAMQTRHAVTTDRRKYG